ncbi:amidohydrolase [Paenibacillus amylolyticus]|uniref:amidohydrolase n=1 Tax=Paenibacillus amylolyticus TaxID=1451 RepID=UPI00201E2DA7|nr:amidohydrolase [Paenibacillus amylolyticus]MCL6660999.1 amidohydrolase [Paenibacillus amylolyticus]
MMDIIALRRDLHEHPELGFTEFRTATKVVQMLTELGYSVTYGKDAIDDTSRRGLPKPEVLEDAYQRALREGADPVIVEQMRGGFTAVVAELQGEQAGPTTAFRFDMDALPIRESKLEQHAPQAGQFRSSHEGIMHACAHDGHTTIGLALAERLSNRKFAGKIRLLFQPAEEGVRGAYAMVEKGMLEQVDRLFCMHLGTGVPSGHIRGASAGFLATTKLEAHFTGVSSHAGASPEEGRNALLGAATAMLNIHALPRFSSADTRINVGILEGGTGANIIAEHARMVIETRSTSEETNRELERRVRHIIEHSAAMHELTATVEVVGSAIPIQCDMELAELAVQQAEGIAGFTHAEAISDSAALGSEDASYMIRRVQEQGGRATYMIVGSELPAPHHHPEFDIDEAVLAPAVELLEKLARTL